MENTNEKLNFYKICIVATRFIPEGLRKVFKREWDALYAESVDGQWNDTTANYAFFCSMESRSNRRRYQSVLSIMRTGDRKEWVSPCLFYAIMDSDSVGPKLQPIVKNSLNDLRRIYYDRYAHAPDSKLSKADFQECMQAVIRAFTVLKLDTTSLEELKFQINLPTKELQNIEKQLNDEAKGVVRKSGPKPLARYTGNGPIQLWQFLLELLLDPAHNKTIIEWTHDRKFEFTLLNPTLIATMWGKRTNKPSMNYKNLSRSLKYYYDKDIIDRVHGKRYMFQFVCDIYNILGYDPTEQKTEGNVEDAVCGEPEVAAESPEFTTDHSPENVDSVAAEIIARGPKAEQAYRRALEQGKVSVYRGRIMIIGPERVGKTSLRKALCGLPFNADEPSTVGVDVCLCSLDIDHVMIKNWKLKDDDKLLGDDVIPRMLAMDLKSSRHEAEIPMRKGSHDNNEDRTIDHDGEMEEELQESTESASNEGIKKAMSATPSLPENVIHTVESKTETRVPDEITEMLIKFLQDEHLDETITDKEVIVSIWDFAGQQPYYASHQVFMSQKAVYVLVYDLSKDLDAKAAPRVRQGILDILLDNPHNETNLDCTLSWLASIHNLCQDDERREFESKTEKNARQHEARPYRRPPVIIVGTHADSLSVQEAKDMEKKLKMGLMCKSYQKHVVKPYFVVSNVNSSDDEGIQKLHQIIQKVFDEEPHMGNEVPVRWLHFERAIQKLVEEKKTYFLRMEEVEKVAKDVCFIEDQDELMTMLDFFHDLGNIIKYGATVVLNAQWLIGLFKTLITIRPYDDQTDSRYTEHWMELEKSGKLSMELVEHVLGEQLTCDQAKEDLLKMMEHFGLIVPFMPSEDGNERCYFVPSQLISSPSKVLNQCQTSQGPCPLYIHFLDGFVPHGLYPLLVSKFISWCSANAGSHAAVEPCLYRDASQYILDSSSRIAMTVVCCRSFIKVLLQCKSEDNSGLHGKAVEVKSFIENTLNELSEQCWYRCLRYKLCVSCPACAKKPCITHRTSSCADEKCLHLLPIIKDQAFLCMKSCDDDRWPDVPGYHYWCPEMHSASIKANLPSICSRSASLKGTLKLGDNVKRWLVVGIALNTMLLSPLRNYLEPFIESHYESLKRSPHNFHTQSFASHLKKDGTATLNYGSINSNEAKKARNYDYCVTSFVDLAKLYLKPFMAKFTGFNETCDASAVLGILVSASVFSPAIRAICKKVKEDVRNKWGHCNIQEWDEPNFDQCFKTMVDLVGSLGLSTEDEKRLTDELNEWRTEGVQSLMPEGEIKLLKDKVSDLSKDLPSHVDDDVERRRVNKLLESVQKAIEELLIEIREEVELLKISHEALEERVDSQHESLKESHETLERRVTELESSRR